MLFRQILFVYCKSRNKYASKFFVKNSELSNANAGSSLQNYYIFSLLHIEVTWKINDM